MKERIEEGRLSRSGQGLGTVTEAMVRRRAAEIATINGREPEQVLDSDVEQARKELTGEEGLVPEPTEPEQVPQEQPAIGNQPSVGERAVTIPAPDEQTFAEKLVEEGVQEAEHDKMLEATRDARRRDAA